MQLINASCFICIFYLFKVVFCEKKTLCCPFTDPLCSSNKLNEYDLVYVKKGDDVTIPCCQRPMNIQSDKKASKSWLKKDRFMREEAIKLIGRKSKFFTVENFGEENSGAYYCIDEKSKDQLDNYYYLIDVVLESPTIFGDPKDDTRFFDKHLKPINEYLGNYHSDSELRSLYQETGLTLVVNLRFDEWLPCNACKKEKKRIGHCHLEPRLVQPDLCRKQCELYKFALRVDCRATWTLEKILPSLAQRINQVPDFGKIIKCMGDCMDEMIPDIDVVEKYKFERVPIRTTLKLICPDYSITKKCHWTRDGVKLHSDVYDPDAAVSVNEFAVLLIRSATHEESGRYNCYLDGELGTKFTVVVYEEFSEKWTACWRHMKYLMYVILLCAIVIVVGLVISIMRRNSYEEIDVNQALARFLRHEFDHEKIKPPEVS